VTSNPLEQTGRNGQNTADQNRLTTRTQTIGDAIASIIGLGKNGEQDSVGSKIDGKDTIATAEGSSKLSEASTPIAPNNAQPSQTGADRTVLETKAATGSSSSLWIIIALFLASLIEFVCL
jgi:hypothetical protein